MSFTDIVFENGVLSSRTGLFVMEEGLIDGKWLALGNSAAGYMMSANPRPAPAYFEQKLPAFLLNIDGQDMTSHLSLISFAKTETESRVTLRHAARDVEITIINKLDGTPILSRRMEVKNTSDKPAAIASAAPLAGTAIEVSYARKRVAPGEAPFRAGYMHGTTWGNEGDFRWHDLPDAEYSVRARRGRDRHRHPMFTLESKLTGEMFICQFAWSGGCKFTFDANMEKRDAAHLSWSVSPEAPAPLMVLAPGETYSSPEVHVGAVFGGLDAAVNAMHAHLKKSVLMPQGATTGLIESGIGPEYNMDIKSTLLALEHARGLGSEVFFIDAGWYLPPNREEDWWFMSGDWRYNEERYPNGIGEVREKTHAAGLKFGMWMDAERVGDKCALWREHPEWIAREYDGKLNHSGLLNLSNPEACKWVEAQIEYLINEYKIDMFRLDYNVDVIRYDNWNENFGYIESNQARYYENVYAMYARLRAKYPNVIFENCAGGGARTDVGMVKNFTHTWVTDWQLHPNAFRITNGMTMALPCEYVDRLIGGQTAYLTGDMLTQMRNLVFARPSVGVIRPLKVKENPEQTEIVRRYVEFYKRFVRPMHENYEVFHHTPELPGDTPQGHGIIEMASPTRGMIGVFKLSESEGGEITVYPRGVKPEFEYEVYFDNARSAAAISGFTLQNQGIKLRLPGALTSELITYKIK